VPEADNKLAADRHHYRKKRTMVATKLPPDTLTSSKIINNAFQHNPKRTVGLPVNTHTTETQHRHISTPHSTTRAQDKIRTVGLPVEVELLLGDATVADLADTHQLSHLIVMYSSVFSGAKVGA
jgi:hypothetical protein